MMLHTAVPWKLSFSSFFCPPSIPVFHLCLDRRHTYTRPGHGNFRSGCAPGTAGALLKIATHFRNKHLGKSENHAFSVCSEVSFAVNVHQLGHDHPQKMFASRVWQVSWNHLKGGTFAVMNCNCVFWMFFLESFV